MQAGKIAASHAAITKFALMRVHTVSEQDRSLAKLDAQWGLFFPRNGVIIVDEAPAPHPSYIPNPNPNTYLTLTLTLIGTCAPPWLHS